MSNEGTAGTKHITAHGVRVAYLVVYFALLIAGLVVRMSPWLGALIGVAAMIPIAVANVLVARRDRKG